MRAALRKSQFKLYLQPQVDDNGKIIGAEALMRWPHPEKGMVPPSDRGEEYNDAASKTHINNDAAQYYDYAVSYILLFQFHDHIAKNILKQDPHATNYYGSKEVGNFLRGVLESGANNDWRELLKESVGSEMSAKPMLDDFAPSKKTFFLCVSFLSGVTL